MTARVLVELEALPGDPHSPEWRDAWLAVRRQGIGSSDVAAVCGVDPYGSPLSVFLDKIGEADETPENEMMRWGRRLEDAIAAEFSERTGYKVEKPPAIYQHSDLDFMIASPDRFVGERGTPKILGLLEEKTSRVDDRWEDGPPRSVILQTTHQLHVMERDKAWIAVLLHGRDYRQWELNYDPELAAQIVEIETDFWKLVENREAPPVDGHPATSDALARLYKNVEPQATVDLTPIHETLMKLRVAKARCEETERIKAALENEVKQAMGTATVGKYGGEVYVTWNQIRGRVDYERLFADHPEIEAVAETYRKEPGRRFLPKKGLLG